MTARYLDGRIFHIAAGDQMYATIFFRAEWEPQESVMVRRMLRPGDFAIDVGANHGWYSLLMAKAVGHAGKVWAVEPVSPLVGALEANLQANREVPVEVFPVAVGGNESHVDMHIFSGLPHGHASFATLGRVDYETLSVPQVTLDHLIDDCEVGPDFVKVDVEGAELEVLKGASRLLRRENSPIWMFEVNHQTAAGCGFRPEALIEKVLASQEHSVFRLAEGRLRPESDPTAAPHGATWFCVPSARLDRLGADGVTTDGAALPAICD